MELLNKIIHKTLKKIVSELRLWKFIASKNKISVLTYHGITGGDSKINDFCFVCKCDFEKQMEFISKNFEVKSAEDAYFKQHDKRKPIAVITFDDGFFNNYSHAFPILKKYNIPATIFLSTSFIDSNNTIWFCKIIQYIESRTDEVVIWKGQSISIKTSSDKRLASSIIQADIKKLHPAEINGELNCLYGFSGNIIDYTKTSFGMLTKESIKEMQDSKLVTFGAHTHNHVILSRLSENECELEVTNSIEKVKILTGKECKMFAYPNGGKDDYDDRHKLLLKNLNIDLTFSMKDGLSSKNDDLFEIKRLFISSHISMKQFAAQVHGY